MMGRQEAGQAPLFYAFNLEEHVPTNHLLRGIDQFLDLGELHQHLAPHYSHTGRPSVDPALLIRMLIVGYCFGIRSERRLCEEVHLNLAYRWFCRLGLEDAVPDHSTFSKNRHGRFRDNDTLRFVFEKVLDRCLAEGLVGDHYDRIAVILLDRDSSIEIMLTQSGSIGPSPLQMPEIVPSSVGRRTFVCRLSIYGDSKPIGTSCFCPLFSPTRESWGMLEISDGL